MSGTNCRGGLDITLPENTGSSVSDICLQFKVRMIGSSKCKLKYGMKKHMDEAKGEFEEYEEISHTISSGYEDVAIGRNVVSTHTLTLSLLQCQHLFITSVHFSDC